MEMLFHAHSGLRYLVLLAGAVALGFALAGWLGRTPFGRAGRLAGAAFVGLLDLQVVLGLATLLTRPFYGALIGHIVLMLLAAVLGHVGLRLARVRSGVRPGGATPPPRRVWTPLLASVLAALAAIVLGILAIGRDIL